jgi:hypothetical protein
LKDNLNKKLSLFRIAEKKAIASLGWLSGDSTELGGVIEV